MPYRSMEAATGYDKKGLSRPIPTPYHVRIQVARLGATREGLWLVRQAGGRLRNGRQRAEGAAAEDVAEGGVERAAAKGVAAEGVERTVAEGIAAESVERVVAKGVAAECVERAAAKGVAAEGVERAAAKGVEGVVAEGVDAPKPEPLPTPK
eukprot:1194810-Prorocentrum_minimum.AAC.13